MNTDRQLTSVHVVSVERCLIHEMKYVNEWPTSLLLLSSLDVNCDVMSLNIDEFIEIDLEKII